MIGRVDAAGDEDPCNGSAGKGKGSKWSGEDFVDSDLGSVPMRAAKSDDVGVIATDGDGAGGSGGVEQAVFEEELDCERGTVGLGVFSLGRGRKRDVSRGDDGPEPIDVEGGP